jgi:hypothetical protein
MSEAAIGEDEDIRRSQGFEEKAGRVLTPVQNVSTSVHFLIALVLVGALVRVTRPG